MGQSKTILVIVCLLLICGSVWRIVRLGVGEKKATSQPLMKELYRCLEDGQIREMDGLEMQRRLSAGEYKVIDFVEHYECPDCGKFSMHLDKEAMMGVSFEDMIREDEVHHDE